MDGGKQTNKTNIGRWRVDGVKYMRPSLKATRVINILLDSRHSNPLSVLIIAEQYNYLAAELKVYLQSDSLKPKYPGCFLVITDGSLEEW